VVAVDPSSPFSGGAVLGDRVRMRDLAGDPGVFIRSMASRGALGGLAHTTAAVVQVLDAAGFEVILIETVGAGQDEVDIARLAHTTLVIEAPGGGDDIQSIKAGILEIADILVVNKADHPGAENTLRILRSMLEMSPHSDWTPLIVRTVATLGTGTPELAAAIAAHHAYLEQSGEKQRREDARLQAQLTSLLSDTLLARFRGQVSPALYDETLLALRQRQLSPHEAVQRLLDQE
jgi:LAO/AO transport system kinase